MISKPTLHLKSFLFSKFHSALAFHFQWVQSFLQVQTSLLQSSGLEPDNTIHIRNIAIQQWPPYPFLYLLVPESSRKWWWFHNNAIKMREASFIQCPIMLFQSPCYALFFSEDDEWNLEQKKINDDSKDSVTCFQVPEWYYWNTREPKVDVNEVV